MYHRQSIFVNALPCTAHNERERERDPVFFFFTENHTTIHTSARIYAVNNDNLISFTSDYVSKVH